MTEAAHVMPGTVRAAPLAPRTIAERGPRVEEAQGLLDRYFGHDVLSNDAKLGSATSRHILRFQRAEGLVGPNGMPTDPRVTPGLLDDHTLDTLRVRAPQGYRAAIERQVNPELPRVLPGSAPVLPGGAFQPRPTSPDETSPGTPELRRYTAREGDTLDHIAREHHVPLNDLLRHNPGLEGPSDRLYAGDTVYLPPRAQEPEPRGVPVRDAAPTEPAGAWENPPSETPLLERGRTGNRRNEHVVALQQRLTELGYKIGRTDVADGLFGAGVQEGVRLFQAINELRPDGRVGPETWRTLTEAGARPAGMLNAHGTRYPANAPHTVEMFREAIRRWNRGDWNNGSPPSLQIPESMAADRDMHWLLSKENAPGIPGLPNFTITGGRIPTPEQQAIIHARIRHDEQWTSSRATGFGQLQPANVRRFYPNGLDGIGDPHNEAIGMIRYMYDSWGSWAAVRRGYNTRHQGW